MKLYVEKDKKNYFIIVHISNNFREKIIHKKLSNNPGFNKKLHEKYLNIFSLLLLSLHKIIDVAITSAASRYHLKRLNKPHFTKGSAETMVTIISTGTLKW